MNKRHTAGTWQRNIPPASKYPTIFAGRNTHVARVVTEGLPPEEIEANTDLIVASPALLSLARRFVTTLNQAGVKPVVDSDNPLEALHFDAIATINQAEGRK